MKPYKMFLGGKLYDDGVMSAQMHSTCDCIIYASGRTSWKLSKGERGFILKMFVQEFRSPQMSGRN